MKPSLFVLAAAAVVAAAVFASSRLSAAPASSPPDLKPCAASDRSTLFGHIESLTATGDHFVLRFDPAWFLSGVTANTAAAEDGAVEPGQPVPNDNYVVEEGHRLLTYRVPTAARVTVLTQGGKLDRTGFPATAVSVSDLAALVRGEAPVELFEPLETGFWMRADVDRVCSLDQQYHP